LALGFGPNLFRFATRLAQNLVRLSLRLADAMLGLPVSVRNRLVSSLLGKREHSPRYLHVPARTPVDCLSQAASKTLDERQLQLLNDPERPLDPWHVIQLAAQLATARIIPLERQDDYPQHSTRREPNTRRAVMNTGQEITWKIREAISRAP